MSRSARVAVVLVLLVAAAPAGGPRAAAAPPGPRINDFVRFADVAAGPLDALVPGAAAPAANPSAAVLAATIAESARFAIPAVLTNVQVSHAGPVSNSVHLMNDFSEDHLSVDPTNSQHLLGASKFFYDPANYAFYIGGFDSTDGGLTWFQQLPAGIEQTYGLTSDPVTSFDHVGNGWVGALTRSPDGLAASRLPAGSQTFDPPVPVVYQYSLDKNWAFGDMHPASPCADNQYVSWTNFAGAYGIQFSRSTDAGATWSAPLQIVSGSAQGSVVGAAAGGTVYVVWWDTGSQYSVRASTDCGQTFGATHAVATITPIPWVLPNRNFRNVSLPAFYVSPTTGTLHVAWSDYRNADADIYYVRSTDGGLTWTAPVRINGDPLHDGIDQFQPQITVAPNGRVSLSWFDRRLPCPPDDPIPGAPGQLNACIDTFLTRSTDDGQTWMPNLRVSLATWEPALNAPPVGGVTFIGDYQGLAATNACDYPFWNATANLGQNPDYYQQIFTTCVPTTTVGVQGTAWLPAVFRNAP